MKFSLFSIVLISTLLFACSSCNSSATGTSKESLKTELLATQNAIETEVAKLLKFRDRSKTLGAQSKEAGLFDDPVFKNKVNEYREIGKKMHKEAKTALETIVQQQTSLGKLETAITPELSESYLNTIKMGKESVEQLIKGHKAMTEMENGFYAQIAAAQKE